MARKSKQSKSYVPVLNHEGWLAEWSARVGYTPPSVPEPIEPPRLNGDGLDPTLFTSLGPSKRTRRGRE